jgi:putative transposase
MVSAGHVHLVIATNYRRGVLDSAILQCCQAAIRKVCRDFGAELREFNGEDDHLHLRVEDPHKVALSTLVDSLGDHQPRRSAMAHLHLRRIVDHRRL